MQSRIQVLNRDEFKPENPPHGFSSSTPSDAQQLVLRLVLVLSSLLSYLYVLVMSLALHMWTCFRGSKPVDVNEFFAAFFSLRSLLLYSMPELFFSDELLTRLLDRLELESSTGGVDTDQPLAFLFFLLLIIIIFNPVSTDNESLNENTRYYHRSGIFAELTPKRFFLRI